jgi:DNA ligase 1
MSDSQVRPMLATSAVVGKIRYPKLVSPKYNGVRGFVHNGKLMARSLKTIPNHHTRELFSSEDYEGFDGELIVGAFGHKDVFVNTQSGVTTLEGEPDVRFFVFDLFNSESVLKKRVKELKKRVDDCTNNRIVCVKYHLVKSDEQLIALDHTFLEQGFEGSVLRDPDGPYKYGRSTEREQGFMRFCYWHTSEAEILDIEERMHNANPSRLNELGYSDKSSHKANMVPTGTAGTFVVKDVHTGQKVRMPVPGTALQVALWQDIKKYVGQIIRYKFRSPAKVGGLPRFPQYEGFRSPIDMGG